MVNVLLEGCNIDAPWLYEALKNYLRAGQRVAIVAFSFRDSRIRGLSDWNSLYSPEDGRYYRGIVDPLAAYGITEKDVTFLNYFTHTKEDAKRIVQAADVVYFLGGLPDRMMDRIREFELYDILMHHNGVMMGYSAGALIQLAEYHLSPDEDYPEFGYFEGLPFLNDFYLEVHYEGTEVQNEAIQTVLAQRQKTVYATSCMKGSILVDGGEVHLLGDVKKYEPA